MKIKLGIVVLCILFILGFAVYQYFSIYDGRLHVVFCDVGQGDGIYIRTPNGTDIIIDAGRDDKILTCLSNNMPFWDKTIELAFATHPDADHISGFVPILQSYKVNHYNTVEAEKDTGVFLKINSLLKEQGITPRYLKLGDAYRISDGVILKTYWPTKEFIAAGDSDSNRYSLVQTLSYKDFDVLLTGDIDFDILNEILRQAQDDPSTGSGRGISGIEVFKLAHHGSKTGLDSETLTLIKPRLSIISAGKNNSYGHPHTEVLDELKRFDLRYLRTDEQGEVELVTQGQGFGVE